MSCLYTYSKSVGLINVKAMVKTSKIAIRQKYHPNALIVAITIEDCSFHVLFLGNSNSDDFRLLDFRMDPFW